MTTQTAARLAGLFGAVDARQPLGPLLIGERANATGSKKFRDMLLADDFDGMLRVLQSQEGAHVLDLSVAYAGRNEVQDMKKIVSLAARSLTQPLMLDSTNPDALEAALMRYPGRPIINSVHLEDGGKTLSRVAGLAKTWGAALVALTIDEKGMALTRARKVEVALRLRETLAETGLRDEDIFFDCLTFTIGSGDASLVNAASETLAAIAELRRRLPNCHRILGVSNVSFGLKPACRRILNSVFLAEAVNAGLNAAIVDASAISPLAEINPAERELALNLIYNRGEAGEPLAAIIRHFEASGEGRAKKEAFLIRPAEEILAEKFMKGGHDGLEAVLSALLERYSAGDIINTLLIPIMRKIGVLFGNGEMLLPFVLRAAETMREAVAIVRPYLPKTSRAGRLKILLATVQGDVHDIGKNLVDLILSNNGYEVFNIGIKQNVETIMAKAKEYEVDAIGLSGLLVKSALVMKESLARYAAAGMNVPVLLGGAALTRRFVAQECAPLYPGPVVYCKDPFDALKALEDLSAGRLCSTSLPAGDAAKTGRAAASGDAAEDEAGPRPGETLKVEAPFTGRKLAADFDFAEAAANINKTLLFRGRWGFTKNAANGAEYERLLRETVGPLYGRLMEKMEARIELKAVYGYVLAQCEGDSLNVEHGGKTYRFGFPRGSSGLCLADFFRREDGPAFLPLFAVTLGREAVRLVKEAYESDSYQEYLFLHGLAAELTDALAETLHRRMATELRLAELAGKAGFTGARYGFGYPACPNLELNAPLLELLGAAEIGLGLTETLMLEPEYSTCGIIACHPDARYLSL
jgi:5-methyltetrahydrofolate--homocysteine methyltransferase